MSFIPEDVYEYKGGIVLFKWKALRFGGQVPLFGKYLSNKGDTFYRTISKTHLEKGIKKMKEKLVMMEELLKTGDK